MSKINVKETLIMMIDNASGKFQDKTSQVQWYQKDPNCVRVKFYGNDTFFRISYQKIEIYTKKRSINPNKTEVYYHGQLLRDIEEIIDFGVYFKLFYDNQKNIVSINSDFCIINNKNDPSIQWQLRFNYFKELSKQVQDGDYDFLSYQYEHIDPTQSHTVLNRYLTRSNIINKEISCPFIYPFGLNLSQKEAVENAFSSNISFIEGPPGTGKTQTILNIISNAVYQNKTVAVVSNNNSAIDNVREKLNEQNLGFMTALLGNKNNKMAFFEEKSGAKRKEIIASWDIDNFDINYLERECRKYQQKLPNLYQKENTLAKLKTQLTNLNKEYEHFMFENNNVVKPRKKIVQKTKDLRSLVRFKIVLEHTQKKSILKVLFLRIKYGFDLKHETDESIKNLINYLDSKYYELKIKNIKKEIIEIEKHLKNEDFIKAKSRYQEMSSRLLKIKLTSKYSIITPKEYTYENYKNEFKDFMDEYPVILSTTHSLIPSAEHSYVFDYLIIDEASQTDLLSSVLSLNCARNAIIVGDSKQLPQIENMFLKEKNYSFKKLYNISDEYDYFGNNILSSMSKVFSNAPKVMLKEHYRCHPLIINFCNQKFYDNQLIILTNPGLESNPLKLYKTVPGNHARKNPNGSGFYNLREVDEINLIVKNSAIQDIGVISPYRKQVEVLNDSIEIKSEKIEIDTVHKFQGRAKDVVILSTVVNDIRHDTTLNPEKEDFVSKSDLLNVAVSRAKKQLILVVSDKIYQSKNNNIADLIKYIQYNSSVDDIQEGRVKSVFDILYTDYQLELEKFRKNNYRAQFDTESITLKLIKDVLAGYRNLKVNMHIPLHRLIKNYSSFDSNEQKYLKNPWTHVDFLISNSVTKEVVLVVEVDGVSFHEQSKHQSNHDEIKDRALALNNINLIRLKTNQSNEKDRITKAIYQSLIND
jgi:superfamily I DNA and/or RNA helicase/very-short-patch-repair endonuclease